MKDVTGEIRELFNYEPFTPVPPVISYTPGGRLDTATGKYLGDAAYHHIKWNLRKKPQSSQAPTTTTNLACTLTNPPPPLPRLPPARTSIQVTSQVVTQIVPFSIRPTSSMIRETQLWEIPPPPSFLPVRRREVLHTSTKTIVPMFNRPKMTVVGRVAPLTISNPQ